MNEPQRPQPQDPKPGMIYEHGGKHFLYVRTEARPGATGPEHLYVTCEKRMMLTHWVTEALPEAELVIDTDGRAQANAQSWETYFAQLSVDLLLDLLKQACEWLPKARADDLRRDYTERRAAFA